MLARFLANDRDKLEADFQQFYGLDLEGLGSSFSIRHAANLAANLPAEARCIKTLDDDLEWSQEMHMLANIEHGIRALIWTVGVANSTSKVKPPFPKRIDPPSKTKKIVQKMEATDINEINRVLGL